MEAVKEVARQVEESGEVFPGEVAVTADSVVVICHPDEGYEVEANHGVV